jgi:NAD(P)H-quinone oxidoreductase subunit 5
LPSWVDLNKDVALLLIWSTIFGVSLGAVVYLGKAIPKPVQLPWKGLQDLLAYDFYTPKLYKSSIVFGVDLVSRMTSWFDQYLVDGMVNLFGLATIFSGQSLKYSNSGQLQFYVLTILLGLTGLSVWLSWPLISHLTLIFNATTPTPPVG